MWGSVKVTVPPVALPLDAAGMKTRLRLDDMGAAEDALLLDLIRAAVAGIDGPKGIGVALMRQTWTLTLDRWPADLELPGWPVADVAEVRAMGPDGAWQVIDPAEYRLIAGRDPVRLVPALGKSWPTVAAAPAAIEIDYTLGAETPADVDAGLVTAVALLAGHYFENREAVLVGVSVAELPLGVQHILRRFRRGVAAA